MSVPGFPDKPSASKRDAGWLTPRGRSFAAGAFLMLVLMQTGAKFDWPVITWLREHQPSVSVEQPQQTEEVTP